MRSKKQLKVGQMVRFMLQAGGFAMGQIVETYEKNKFLYKVKTATGEFNVMHAEVTWAGAVVAVAA